MEAMFTVILENDLQISKPNCLHSGYSVSDENSGKVVKVKKLKDSNESLSSMYVAGTKINKRYSFANRGDIMYMIFAETLLEKTEEFCLNNCITTFSKTMEVIDFENKRVVEKLYNLPYYDKKSIRHEIIFLPYEMCVVNLDWMSKSRSIELIKDIKPLLEGRFVDIEPEILILGSENISRNTIKETWEKLKRDRREEYEEIHSLIRVSDSYNALVTAKIKEIYVN